MIGQSVAIVAVILVMLFMFMRAGKRSGAVFAMPLLCVPWFHLLGMGVHRAIGGSFTPQIVIDCVGFLLGACLCAILSRAIAPRRLRWAYLALCIIFQAALALIYILFLLGL